MIILPNPSPDTKTPLKICEIHGNRIKFRLGVGAHGNLGNILSCFEDVGTKNIVMF